MVRVRINKIGKGESNRQWGEGKKIEDGSRGTREREKENIEETTNWMDRQNRAFNIPCVS